LDTGSVLLIISILILVGLIVFRPFYSNFPPFIIDKLPFDGLGKAEERLTGLALERDRLFSAMQELDTDHELQKIPDEAYLSRRNEFRNAAAGILKQIDDLDAHIQSLSAADNEPAVKSPAIRLPDDKMDEIEEMIAARRRSRHEKSAGFCPRCGKVIQKSDQYCPTCGSKVTG
jgi:hypothetical protein